MSSNFSQNNILFGISQGGEVTQNANMTVLLEKEEVSRILTIAQQYGSLTVAKHNNGFALRVSTYQFYVTLETARSAITFEDVSELSTEMAGLFVELADILFPKRQSSFVMITDNVESEFTLWQQAVEHNITFEPRNDQQIQNFKRWHQALKEATLKRSSILRQQPEHKKHASSATFAPRIPHNITLQLNYGALSPLCDLMIAYGELNFSLVNGQLQLHIANLHLSIVVEHNRVTLNILSIDLTKPGAGELLSKILDAFFYDRQRRIEITMPEEARLKIFWGALHQAGIQITPKNPEQAKLLARFAREWLHENRQQFTALFNQLKDSGAIDPDVTLENN